MKKMILTLMASALAAVAPAVAQQTASFWWGYGDGETIWKGVGGGSNPATQTAAIKVPAEVMTAYAGSRIKSIRFAVTSNTGSVTDASYFLSTNLEEIAAEELTSVGTLSAGWHTFELTSPYQITAGNDLYIGYTVTGVRPVAIVDEPGCEGSCWMKNGKRFYDYGVMEGYNYTLGVQALIESDNFEASLSFSEAGDVKAEPTGGIIPLSVRSLSPVEVTSYTISYSVDGEHIGEKTAECYLPQMDDVDTIELPLPALALGEHTYEAQITDINGKAVETTIKASGKLEVQKYVMYRTHVIEEKTGTWCGYCVRGLVAMREMNKNHPNRFIGIAVHGEDKYETSSYATLLSRGGGYPSAFFNRNKVVGTTPSEMESAFQNSDELAECEVKIVGIEYANAARNSVNIYMRYRFDRDHSQIDYRIAVVTVEDNLPDMQANYYSGGGLGPMGGFENLGSYAHVDLMDVARNITHYTGIVNSVPAQLEEGRWYDYCYTYMLPNSIANRNNIAIIALLQDATGTEILNADRCRVIHEQGELGIDTPQCDPMEAINAYDIYGHRLHEDYAPAGLSIRNGKVIFSNN